LIVLSVVMGDPFGLKSFIVRADNAAQTLPFSQNWTNTALITTNDTWTGVPGIIGYRGDALVSGTGVNPQTVLTESTVVNVIANQTNPNTCDTYQRSARSRPRAGKMLSRYCSNRSPETLGKDSAFRKVRSIASAQTGGLVLMRVLSAATRGRATGVQLSYAHH